MSNVIVQLQDTTWNPERSYSQGYDLSSISVRKYANRIGADYALYSNSLSKTKPQWSKAYLARELANYDRVLYLDSDMLVHPNAPDIFAEYPDPQFIYAVANVGSMDWVCRSTELYAEVFDTEPIHPDKYFNSGLLMFSPEHHREIFDKVIALHEDQHQQFDTIESQYHVGTDQPVLNYVFCNHIKLIPYQWNMQDLTRHELLDSELILRAGHISHYNAGIKPSPRDLMNKVSYEIGN